MKRFLHPQNWIPPLRPLIEAYLSIAARFIRPDPSVVICGAMNGLLYGDNSQHLFEWMLEHRPDLSPVWITRSWKTWRRIRSAGRPALLAYSPRALHALLRARVGVFTDNLHDISMDPWILPKTLSLIALRHGRSVKRVRFARRAHKISAEEAERRRFEGELTRYAISTSEFISELQELCLEIGPEKHVVTGYPRNDALLQTPDSQRQAWNRFMGGRSFRKVILYAPSWRHGRYFTRFFPFDDFDLEALEHFLEEHDCLMLLRPHRLDLGYPENRAYLAELSRQEHVQLATHEELPDVNSFLPFIDSLICDYSALYHDYLLLDRPMLFVPYDIEDFESQNGFLYPYLECLPGPDVRNFPGFLSKLGEIMDDRDPHREARHRLRDRIHAHQDAGATARVVALIDEIRAESS
ncbi:MAG: hypothetical protein CL908_18265 [Deltaproteobacteria bacterium]|nr:hypothetical protein [Deltaproteobacteria bacterium]